MADADDYTPPGIDQPKKPEGDQDDKLAEGKKLFAICQDVENDNRKSYKDDTNFVRARAQWPADIRAQREAEGRPCLTIDRLGPVIRQVVNDSRQNKPSIKVHPADSGADVKTAEVINGLIRNIEYTSNADVAYDTAVETAVGGNIGYIRVVLKYAYDDSFELDIGIERVPNPLAIYGDPYSTSASSDDWNTAFVVDKIPRDRFKASYPKAVATDWDADPWTNPGDWLDGDQVLIAEWWEREEYEKTIVMLSDGSVRDEDDLEDDEDLAALIASGVVSVALDSSGNPKKRVTKCYRVWQRIMTGAEILSEREWPGKYIPIIPVYGDEFWIEGKRYLRSLINGAKDAQMMLNFWRPLALDTPLPTPTGWTTMGSVQVGDELFDERGKPCKVVGKSPVHIQRKCYRVTFDDGSSIVADADHPWFVEERAGRRAAGTVWESKVITTTELEPKKHYIPTPGALDCEDVELPVDPYVLGFWLGDGDTTYGKVTPGDGDFDEVQQLFAARGYQFGITRPKVGAARHATPVVLGLTPKLRAAGVLGHKHIPDIYLRASEAQRRELLRGLMDSDGTINGANRCCGFTTTLPKLAEDMAELLRSLGIKAKADLREGRGSRVVNGPTFLPSYQFRFSAYADEAIFGLARKAARLKLDTEHRRRTKRFGITSVVSVPSVPVQCVAIDAPSHLFLAGESMVPTHNTSGTELVALAPKVPFIGPRGAFDKDLRWNTANTKSHPYLEYEGAQPPQRQPLDTGAAAGALQEALNATDDIKAITGIYDASLGARSNETSGRAIIARQKEGDTSTFNFIDNLSRGIRQTGRVIIDLIPHVYTEERVVRVIGEDGSQEAKQVNKPYQAKDDNGQPLMQGPQGEMPMPPGAQVVPQQQGQPPAVVDQTGQKIGEAVMAMHDLTAGKYDLVVDTGPSYTTQRAETADQMMTLIQAYPDAAPVIGDILVKNLDWKSSDEIAERLKKLLPPQVQGQAQIPPEVQQQIEQGKQLIGQLQQENQQLKTGQQAKMAQTQADQQSKALEREANTQEAQNKITSDEAIAQAKIDSAERIANQEIASRERIAVQTAAFNARVKAMQQPSGPPQ